MSDEERRWAWARLVAIETAAFDRGAKAERERIAKIVEGYCGTPAKPTVNQSMCADIARLIRGTPGEEG